jgi:hypothetical protein
MNNSTHDFSTEILRILEAQFHKNAEYIFSSSDLIKYINIKTCSITKDSKARSSFANHYALYVLIEDYIKGNFQERNEYKTYQGAKF